jgi:hypothetical protein
MPKALIDPRNILQGYDGELWSDDGTFLAQVNTWQAQLNVSNTDYHPAGSPQVVAVMTGYQVTLTFTETVIQDAILLQKLLAGLKQGKQPQFAFQGVLRGHDGTTGRYVFRGCVPDGSIDIVNVQPGQELNRAWSFRVNEAPDLQSLLGE